MIITITNPKNNKYIKFVDIHDIDKFQNTNRGCDPSLITPETQLYQNVFWMTQYPMGFDIMTDPANNYVSTWEDNNSYFTTSSNSQSNQIRKFVIYFYSDGGGVDNSNNVTKLMNDVLIDNDDVLLFLDIVDNFGVTHTTRVRPFKLPIFNSGNLTLELDCPSSEFETKYDLILAENMYSKNLVECENCGNIECDNYYLSQPKQKLIASYQVSEQGEVWVNLTVDFYDIYWSFSNLPPLSRFEINFTDSIIKVNGEDWTYKFEGYVFPKIRDNSLVSILSPGVLRTVTTQKWVHI